MTQIVKIFTKKIMFYHNYLHHLRSIIDFIDRHDIELNISEYRPLVSLMVY